jgi:hypothetical protein
MGGTLARMVDKKNVYRILVGKSEGKDLMDILDICDSLILERALK